MTPFTDNPRPRISRAFIAAVLLAAGTVLQHPREASSWSTAFGIIAAAVSGGARKNGNGDHR